MSPRTGRPRTGQTPNISLRINPDAYHAARIEAVTARKTVGQWIEEAINEGEDTGTKKSEGTKEPQKRIETRLESLARMYAASEVKQTEEGPDEEKD